MRYFALSLATPPSYHHSGQYISNLPYKHPRRTLSDYELFFVAEGELYMGQVGEYRVQKGEVLLQAKGQIQYGAKEGGAVKFYWFHFDAEVEIFEGKEQAEAFCRGREKWIFIPEHFPLFSIEKAKLLLSQFDHTGAKENRKMEKDFLCGALLCFLASDFERGANRPYEDKRFSDMFLWVQEHFHEVESVEELASKYEYNPKYLCTLFKKTVGKTVNAYLTEKRIEKAKELLSWGNAPVKTVARLVGYEDEYYFMRVFKKKTGFTPKAYRKAFFGCIYNN